MTLKHLCSAAVALALAVTSYAGGGRMDPARHILEQAYAKVDKSVIRTGAEWFPYPAYSDRAGWEKLFGPHRKEAVKLGEKYLNYEWQVLKATDYLELERTGNRNVMSNIHSANALALKSLMFAELAEGEGRFIDQIANGVWLFTERTSWVASAHQPYQKTKRALPDYRDILMDLTAQQTGLMMAIVMHFFKDELDKLDPSIYAAAYHAVHVKLLDPYMDPEKLSEQKWLGLKIKPGQSVNNWNPWCNSNTLLAALLIEEDRDSLLKLFDQAVRSTDVYMDTNKMDGGCDEGAGYWGHAPGSVYDFLSVVNGATYGQFGCWDDVQVQAMAFYKSRAFIGDGWVFNFGDCSAKASGGADLVYRFGKDCGLRELSDYALYQSSYGKRPGQAFFDVKDTYRTLEALRHEAGFKAEYDAALEAAGGDVERMRATLRKDVPPFTWYPETGHLFLHNGNGWSFGSKAGHNGESHNHNDVGSCILFIDNAPVLVDAGVGTYTRQTFSKDRYKIWSMQSCWHNLPTINGVDQHNGVDYRASDVKADGRKSTFSLNIAGAYTDDCACDSWTRSYVLKNAELDITDKFVLASRKAADVEHFLVKGELFLPGDMAGDYKVKDGEVVIVAHARSTKTEVKVKLSFPKSLTPSVDEHDADGTIRKNWGRTMKRLNLSSAENAPAKGSYSFKITRLN